MLKDARTTSIERVVKSESGRRYKAEIAGVSPRSARGTFEDHHSCILGVSLENANFRPARLEGMVRWVSRRFAHCTVLVGDEIHRITLESTRGMSPPQALAESRRLGQEFLSETRYIFDAYADTCRFTFITCGEVQTWDSYRDLHQDLRELFDTDPEFRSSVRSFGIKYHEKWSLDVSEAERENRVQRSCDYFLEEFAVFGCLQQHGLEVMAYPGSFSTLSEISAGVHAGAPKELQKFTVVSLDIKGR